ncbi:MAG: hypothetical protein JWN48_919 [Myxococcaceae bacterium]|nr:hypothetical protein [Myxococcaceae bacterium]
MIELCAGADESAFAIMMAELIRTNLADHPEKKADFQAMNGRVALVAEDAESTITLLFRRGRLSVHPGLFGIPDLVIRGTSEALIDLSRLPNHPRFSFLPDLRSSVARSLARALLQQKLRIRGVTVHPGLALKLGRVMSIH